MSGDHSHGLVHDSIKRSREGVRAVAVALAVLGLTTLAQAVVYVASGSVALLADLIHNGGDALTAVPLGIAFLLRSERAERGAGLFVVAAIFVSACVAGVEAVSRLVHPGFVAATGADRLPDLVRYLRAAAVRLEALPERPERDRRRPRPVLLERKGADARQSPRRDHVFEKIAVRREVLGGQRIEIRNVVRRRRQAIGGAQRKAQLLAVRGVELDRREIVEHELQRIFVEVITLLGVRRRAEHVRIQTRRRIRVGLEPELLRLRSR